MKVMMADEAEENNVITKKELQAILLALKPYGFVNASLDQRTSMASVALKIERVLAGMGKTPVRRRRT